MKSGSREIHHVSLSRSLSLSGQQQGDESGRGCSRSKDRAGGRCMELGDDPAAGWQLAQTKAGLTTLSLGNLCRGSNAGLWQHWSAACSGPMPGSASPETRRSVAGPQSILGWVFSAVVRTVRVCPALQTAGSTVWVRVIRSARDGNAKQQRRRAGGRVTDCCSGWMRGGDGRASGDDWLRDEGISSGK